MSDFVVPSWVVTFMPLVVLVVTYLCAKLPAFAEWGPRNVGAVVALVLAAVCIALDPPVLSGVTVMDYAGALVALTLSWWKGAQIIYDLFTGQLGTPEAHAK